MTNLSIERLEAHHAGAIARCFRRVYGGTYANELFDDETLLAQSLASGALRSVGAVTPDGRVLGRMAMVCPPGALFAELGNTVVDPEARGGGLAWKIGAELRAWCIEAGYGAYLHYPTTDHHIMQQRSVETGFETGLMLGYIPASTDGGVGEKSSQLRGAATVVVNPLGDTPSLDAVLPDRYAKLVRELAQDAGLVRNPRAGSRGLRDAPTVAETRTLRKRALERLEVRTVGADLPTRVEALRRSSQPCLQIDLRCDDAHIDAGTETCLEAGFVFCGWLPGYRECDVLRLQRVDPTTTDLQPGVVNRGGLELLEHIRTEISAARPFD